MNERQHSTRWLGLALACVARCLPGTRALRLRTTRRHMHVWLLGFWWAGVVGGEVALQAAQFSFTEDFLLWPNQSNAPTNTWQYFYGVNPTNRTGNYQR